MQFKIFISSLIVLFLFSQNLVQAVNTPPQEKTNTRKIVESKDKWEVTKPDKELRRQNRRAKLFGKAKEKIEKWSKKLKKRINQSIDFNDPVKRWMWLFIIGFAGGLLLTLIGALLPVPGKTVFFVLAALAFIAGAVGLVMWLMNLYG